MTTSIHDSVAALGEREALRMLALVVDHDGGLPDATRTREIEERIQQAAHDNPPSEGHAVSAGELAKATLLHLADNPDSAPVIARAMAIPPDSSRFEPATLGIGALILIALQTEVKLTRSEEGRWSLTIHKPPMGDSRLAELVRQILAYYRNLKG